MSEWPLVRVGDLVAEGALMISDGYRVRNEELGTNGIPFVRGGDIGTGWVTTTTVDHIRPEFTDRVTKKLSQPGDVAFITKGTVGRAGLLRDDQPTVVFAPQVAYWRSLDRSKLHPRFMFYLVTSSAFRNALDAVKTHGSMVADYVSISQQHEFRFRIPEIEKQFAIASILGALDDKIELNRQMNETLEAMARAIFKDWFVDFGPVRAKAEGRPPPGLPPDIAALFPDALDDEDKPMGWRSGRLKEVADAPRRAVTPSEVADDTPYIGLEHMPRRSVALSEWECAGKVTSGKSGFQRGEFLFGKLRPYFHKVGVAPVDGICSTDIVVIRAKTVEWRCFVLSCVSSDEFVDHADLTSFGTKMPRTSWGDMGNFELTLPDKLLADQFEHFAAPLVERIVANIHESKTLAQLRDLLLPKLMSGEIRIKDVETMVDRAITQSTAVE